MDGVFEVTLDLSYLSLFIARAIALLFWKCQQDQMVVPSKRGRFSAVRTAQCGWVSRRLAPLAKLENIQCAEKFG